MADAAPDPEHLADWAPLRATTRAGRVCSSGRRGPAYSIARRRMSGSQAGCAPTS